MDTITVTDNTSGESLTHSVSFSVAEAAESLNGTGQGGRQWTRSDG